MKRIPLILLILLFMFSGCAAQSSVASEPVVDSVSEATKDRYRENEIMEYQGAKLDPAVGPRDNSIKGTQQVTIETYTLVVDGLVDEPLTFTYEQVLALPAYERLITLYCVEGWDATILWEGALLEDIIGPAGVQPEAVTVIFESVDGYTTSLPLDMTMSNQLILAYGANATTLPPEMGYPFIVVAEDKLGYKWARWVSRITLSDDADYKGYWEQRGYSNDATIKD